MQAPPPLVPISDLSVWAWCSSYNFYAILAYVRESGGFRQEDLVCFSSDNLPTYPSTPAERIYSLQSTTLCAWLSEPRLNVQPAVYQPATNETLSVHTAARRHAPNGLGACTHGSSWLLEQTRMCSLQNDRVLPTTLIVLLCPLPAANPSVSVRNLDPLECILPDKPTHKFKKLGTSHRTRPFLFRRRVRISDAEPYSNSDARLFGSLKRKSISKQTTNETYLSFLDLRAWRC